MSLLPLAAFPLAGLIAFVAIPHVVRLAEVTGYVDHPEERKLHTAATPLLGGVAVFTSALLAWVVAMPFLPHSAASAEAWELLAGAAVALVLGLVDDRFGMRPSIKLAGQAVAAAILLAGGAVPHLGLPDGFSGALALVAVIALMNAVNFLDNMNGMVGGLAPIALVGFALTSLARGANGVAAAQLALAGACVGFLPHNFPRAKLFLGDAGSLFLGYCLGASALLAMNSAPAGWGQFGPALVLAYPAFDMVFVVITRLRDGQPVYRGGRDHTNHRLASLVGQQPGTVALVWLAGLALCGSGLLVLRLDQARAALAIGAIWAVVLVVAGFRLAAVPVPRPD